MLTLCLVFAHCVFVCTVLAGGGVGGGKEVKKYDLREPYRVTIVAGEDEESATDGKFLR